jgi:tetratricopeptide (TPR) repeat protein
MALKTRCILEPLTTVEIKASAINQQLEKILESPGFARSERPSKFLRFLVERHLEGRSEELKETIIAIEVFGRRPDYNPKRDATVRIEAGKLRARLAEYYAVEGGQDPLIIELPKGRYVPVIRQAKIHPDAHVRSGWWLWGSLAGSAVMIAGLGLLWTGGVKSHRSKPSGIRRYENSAAYALYLRARAAYHAGQELPDQDLDIYQEAIAKDAAFAPAYAGLAAAYASASSTPIGERKDSLVNMRAAAQRAVQLDPLLPEARDAMGIMYARLGQWEQSRQSFLRAIDLDPNASAARLDSVMNFFLPLGWSSYALQQVQLAEKSDPRSPDVQEVYAYVLISAGQFDQAEGHCRKCADPVECLGRIRIGQGRMDEAIQILTASVNTRYLGFAYGRAGHRAEAERLAAHSLGRLQQVLIYAGLGDKDRTFQALDRMTELGPVRIGRALNSPELAFLRGDPRLKTVRTKVGLPNYSIDY